MKVLLALVLFSTLSLSATADAPLAYQTIQPSKIVMGESAILRITSLDSELNIKMPEVSGLSFEVVGHSRAMEFINGTASESSSIIIRVTPQIAGIFTIPGLTPKSQPLVLEVNTDRNSGNLPLTLNGQAPRPPSPPPPKTGNAAGIHFAADGSAFVQLKMPKRAVYVGESVPVDIEVGVEPGIVTALNGLPTVKGGDFTLNNLSRQPERKEVILDGKPFLTMTWHSVLAAVKPGDFSLTVDTPLTVKISHRPAEDAAFANLLGGPFLQNFYNGIVPKEITITSPPSELHVLALPAAGRPADFSGAVGTFKVASDVSATEAAAGDPLTLRLHVTGAGNFDRVDTRMLDHIEHWKTYPPKSSFSATDATGYQGEKIFEQPLIAAQTGEQLIPGLTFSYFDPETRHYERAQTAPIKVNIATSLADSSLTTPAKTADVTAQNSLTSRLKPDHALTHVAVNSLIPLYLQQRFLILPAALALLVAGGLVGLRRRPARTAANATTLALAHLTAAAQSGNTLSFLATARSLLLDSFAQRWQLLPDRITAAELEARLGSDSADIRQLLVLADEAQYSGHDTEPIDYPRWTQVVRRHLSNLAVLLVAVTLLGSQAHAQSTAETYSASGLYNLANSYARAGKPGLAVLNYERAALLAPNDADIATNLAEVRASLHLPPQDSSRVAAITRFASPTSVAWIGVLGFIVAGAGLLATKATSRWRTARIAVIVVGLTAITFTAGNALLQAPKIHEGVVIAKETPIRVAPVPMGDPVLQLPEAETVTIAAEHEDFVLVRTRTGRSGWAARADIADVVPRQH